MLTTNKTRTLRAEFEKTKNAQFLSSRNVAEFYACKNNDIQISKYISFADFKKSKAFSKEFRYLASLYDNQSELEAFVNGLHKCFAELAFKTLPDVKIMSQDVLMFESPETKKGVSLASLSDHELTAFIMFVVKKCNYDVIFVDNLYVQNILTIKPNFFENAIVKIAGK